MRIIVRVRDVKIKLPAISISRFRQQGASV